MEWSVLFVGPVGAGKSAAIGAISDIEVVSTDQAATDETLDIKPATTVAMDVGMMQIGAADRLRLLGAPGQDRFDFMWDILLEQAKGLVVLVDHSRPNPAEDLDLYLAKMRARMGHDPKPVVIGVTHVDLARDKPMTVYGRVSPEPVFEVDARNRDDVRKMLLVLTALLEMRERIPLRQSD
jgi:uncharacterized protein